MNTPAQNSDMSLLESLRTRRSIRALSDQPVPRPLLSQIVETATWAPAPHHTKPWRFALIVNHSVKERLGRVMGEQWAADLTNDGLEAEKVEKAVTRSRRRIAAAGALVLISLVKSDLQRYPDKRRQDAEYTMGAHSLGAAIENLLLAAHSQGLAGSWMCAPLFCPEIVRESLQLEPTLEPQALILLGYPARQAQPRTEIQLESLVSWIDD